MDPQGCPRNLQIPGLYLVGIFWKAWFSMVSTDAFFSRGSTNHTLKKASGIGWLRGSFQVPPTPTPFEYLFSPRGSSSKVLLGIQFFHLMVGESAANPPASKHLFFFSFFGMICRPSKKGGYLPWKPMVWSKGVWQIVLEPW